MAKQMRLHSVEELARLRAMRRLRDDLGINAAGIEVIMRLRRQVLELQQQVAQLEGMAAAQATRRGARLTSYRAVLIETSWREWSDEE